MNVKILQPDIFRPYKHMPDVNLEKYKAEMSDDVRDLRLYWVRFCDYLVEMFRGAGDDVEKIVLPSYLISQEYIDAIEGDLIFVPHRINRQISSREKRIFYYMQVMTRSLFTVDTNGWGPGSSRYPFDFVKERDVSDEVFNKFRDKMISINHSKFDQKPRKSKEDLIKAGEIPNRDFIFFPCQIPHDESLKFFSPNGEVEIVSCISEWSERSGIPVVYKGHPANLSSMEPLKKIANQAHAYWTDASIHDLIEYSSGVFVINSGVGFESMFHGKPIMTFGYADYDCVTVKADIANIDDAWVRFKEFCDSDFLSNYKRFIDYYVTDYCVDLDLDRGDVKKVILERLEALR